MFKEKFNFDELEIVLNQVKFFMYTEEGKYRWNSINYPTIDKNDPPEKFVENTSTICFSSLNRQLADFTKCNRIIFFFEDSKSMDIPKQKRWLALCKRNGLLPKYASVDRIMRHRALVLDVSKHTRNLMYMYLSVCRFMQEDPCLAINTLRLCEEFKMDFFVALVFATQIRMNNMGHHFLPGDSPYMKPKHVDQLKDIRVQDMVGLYRFIQKGGPQTSGSHSFSANSSVGSMCKLRLSLRAEDTLNPGLAKIIRADTDAEAQKLIKQAKLG